MICFLLAFFVVWVLLNVIALVLLVAGYVPILTPPVPGSPGTLVGVSKVCNEDVDFTGLQLFAFLACVMYGLNMIILGTFVCLRFFWRSMHARDNTLETEREGLLGNTKDYGTSV